jgi:superfamily II DNA or RNA helicase
MNLDLDDDIAEIEPLEELDFPVPDGFALRDYQKGCLDAVDEAWGTYSRQLVVMATGTGKGSILALLAKTWVDRGHRVAVLTHTEELISQLADRIAEWTGITPEVEKAQEYASLSAKIVVASVQTLSREARLTGFPDNHFGLIIIDEAHHVVSKSWLRVVNYFHFGCKSLDLEWVPPDPGSDVKRYSKLFGCTATSDRGDRKSLGNVFDHCSYEYGILDACRAGYLVRPIVKNIPLKIDIKGVKMRGGDFDAHEIGERLTPILREIARNLAIEAKDRKTIVFMPSIDSAMRLGEACKEAGLNGSFVSGACVDRTDKIAAFKAAGKGTVLCNAAVLLEGFDEPTIDCVCVLRPTKIRSLYVQACGRGTRPLTGLIDGLETVTERLAAIAASAKPNLQIVDFLWLTDRLDLIKPIDLVCSKADLREQMDKVSQSGATDLLDMEIAATRDLLKSLEAAAKKNANKAARVMDPLAWAVDLGDEKLATYEPETAFDARPPTPGQLTLLQKQHFDISKIRYFGQASAVITRLMARYRMRLASPQQLHFLHQLGLAPDKATLLSAADASKTIDAILAEKKARRASSGT